MKTSVNVNFTKNNTNKKDETIFEFQVRGNLSDEQIVRLARLKGAGEVIIDIRTSQAEIDDYEEEERHEGVRGTIEKDGSVNLDKGQMTIDEVKSSELVQEQDVEQEQEETIEAVEAAENDPMHGVRLSNDTPSSNTDGKTGSNEFDVKEDLE
ncbi:hypothetical protein [Paenibacillus sp. NRS-1760]|uniref:hypothetical protein n=1 Tax=Paenibacillus sp. NRS-1760 TaxID=3233902 RepID=UPI003D2C75D8